MTTIMRMRMKTRIRIRMMLMICMNVRREWINE